LEEIMTEIFSYFDERQKFADLIFTRQNKHKRSMLMHIIVKLLKVRDKEQILKVAREK
jgi:hypothetical protein